MVLTVPKLEEADVRCRAWGSFTIMVKIGNSNKIIVTPNWGPFRRTFGSFQAIFL